MSPSCKDTEMILERSGVVNPQENPRVPAKIFCANRHDARILLKRLILISGAAREIETGNVDEKQIKFVAVKIHEFLLDLGDLLMIDTGMNQKDINEITSEIETELKKKR